MGPSHLSVLVAQFVWTSGHGVAADLQAERVELLRLVSIRRRLQIANSLFFVSLFSSKNSLFLYLVLYKFLRLVATCITAENPTNN